MLTNCSKGHQYDTDDPRYCVRVNKSCPTCINEKKRAYNRSPLGQAAQQRWKKRSVEGKVHAGGAGWSKGKIGLNAPGWKGGHLKTKPCGYVFRHLGGGKWRKEHRLVAERVLERDLIPEEVVHHRDSDKTNNEPENLVYFPTDLLHNYHHLAVAAGVDEWVSIAHHDGIWLADAA